MKNFIFLSPNFPENYWRFCRGLRRNGMRVLGIGDCPYENLMQDLRENLDEYYRVDDLGNYEEVYRAVAFFLFKYGRADFLESNNEYWLERDARLRADFHITSGLQPEDMPFVKLKSRMKERYRAAGIPFARYCMATDPETCRRFLAEVGYPAVVKPDNGVGANATFRISSEADLAAFFGKGYKGYIMEEYVNGTVCSYDAIVNAEGVPVFETGNITPDSIMDVVNGAGNCMFYIVKELSPEVRARGRAAVASFGVKGRFVHFEFFRLDSDCTLGKKGDIVALEVNLRPSGGCSTDMMNFANSVDVYEIWADMMAGKEILLPKERDRYFCVYFGRRRDRSYRLSHDELCARYGERIRARFPVNAALSPAMGDYAYLFLADTEEEARDFCRIAGE